MIPLTYMYTLTQFVPIRYFSVGGYSTMDKFCIESIIDKMSKSM